MSALEGIRIAILATDGFEKSELLEPLRQLKDAGARVDVVSLEAGDIRSWDNNDWGDSVKVDAVLGSADPDIYDALVLPGGQINPDLLRVEDRAVAFVRKFAAAGKTVAAICHAPWLLVEAGLVDGLRLTSYDSIRTDVENAGGIWLDSAVVCDRGIVTSRNPDDLDAFCAAIVDTLREPRRAA